MPRNTKASPDAGEREPLPAPPEPAFNGADPAAFDHDGDGAPGGSLPVELYAVLLKPAEGFRGGSVVYGPAARIEALITAETGRAATPRDLRIAGLNVHPLT
jgi:hypothetical protein